MAAGEKPACRQLSAVKIKTLENISNHRLRLQAFLCGKTRLE